MQPELVRLSKFISKVLRHQPQLIGLQLDEHGWVAVEALLAAAQRKGMSIDRALLDRIVTENDKQRFAFSPDGTRIRASQGHSLPVDLGLTPQPPPDLLYHGTGQQSLAAILREGLRKGRRHAVHLSTDAATARMVGARHGQPVVLLVQAGRMAADGYAFTRSDNGVWLVDSVPPQYIEVL